MLYQNHLYITPTGFQDLKSKLEGLYRERMDVGRELGAAKEPGDPGENGNLELARDHCLVVDTRIDQIKAILRRATLINWRPHKSRRVAMGSTITLKRGRETKRYMLVGTLESDPGAGRLSDQSSVGQSLLGKQIGERVEIGNGHKLTYTIAAIA